MTDQEQYHIHIRGQVQGVGFRPLVCQLARERGWNGWISNGKDGVHLELAGNNISIEKSIALIREQLPDYTHILDIDIQEVRATHLSGFTIRKSDDCAHSDLVLTPDRGICLSCRSEVTDSNNRRGGYAFTTCLQCGPRYSITSHLPYDRERTTMSPFSPCPSCTLEYMNEMDRRSFSQTNSCPDCAIPLTWEDGQTALRIQNTQQIIDLAAQALQLGQILAVKGLGGYLLMTDARNPEAIRRLRLRKHRPDKPFAIMYPDVDTLSGDVHLHPGIRKLLQSPESPIVICPTNSHILSGISLEDVAPRLDQIGVMLPNTPLFAMILAAFPHPIVATSANLSGSPILYREEDARSGLSSIADHFIHHDREILVPQDDSVIRWLRPDSEPLVIRRSRGYAPAYIHQAFPAWKESVLALGAHMKGALAVQHNGLTHISQYLGNLESFDAEESFKHVTGHLLSILEVRPEVILTDNHPGYFTSRYGAKLAHATDTPLRTYGHHLAHFAAVLAEHALLTDPEPTLGVIWDGTGYGDDHTMWGGEFFVRDGEDYRRLAYLMPFPLILGDKMAREPRLSALSLTDGLANGTQIINDLFPEKVIDFYRRVLREDDQMMTSSMGRLIDGVAALLGLAKVQSFEGQAALYLETLAARAPQTSAYPWTTENEGALDWTELIEHILADRKTGRAISEIAAAFHGSLVEKIGQIARAAGIKRIALSGGVWQNELLNHLVGQRFGNDLTILRHRQLSPNDENIPLGQLALYWQEERGKSLCHAHSSTLVSATL